MSSATDSHSAAAIAVVGMAGRFPGAPDLARFWQNLRDGVESVRHFTDAELLAAGETPETLANPDYVKVCPALERADEFDASFFGFSPQDAAVMDPQHRIFLEIGWQALEDSGHDPERFDGQIGVFATCGMNAYMMHHLVRNQRIMQTVGEWLVRHTGNDMNFLATRLSYELGLKGPSLNVQTACSSALVAIHLASQSLLNLECDLALAGGSVVTLPQNRGYWYKPGEILSPDGHCRPFDARAAGTLFGSGAGIVVLRRLEDALDAGDRVLAVIRGSAINNDGAAKVGYLAPSVEGQSRAVVEALGVSDVAADEISYIEAHGTGTLVGDPIEIAALTEAYRRFTTRTAYCAVGSLKSNIGHLGEAAGVAGFIKTVLSLQHRQLPPTLHYSTPNPQLLLKDSPFFVNAELRDWNAPTPRRAGVTSLGAGGTNCHVIVEEAPASPPSAPESKPQVLVLSAKSAAALKSASERLAATLEERPDLNLADVAHTLQIGRRVLSHRRAVVASSAAQAATVLRSAQGYGGNADAARAPKVVFMFPGTGAQYADMGRGLYEREPVYRRELDRCLAFAKDHLDMDLRASLFPLADAVEKADRELARSTASMLTVFSTDYALAQLWRSLGIEPSASVGHSLGEYVAACLAGVFSLEDALTIVKARGQVFERLPPGGMLSVMLSEDELRPHLGRTLSFAAINAPDVSVVSGPEADIGRLERTLASRGAEAKRLHVTAAAHSILIDPFLDEFRSLLQRISFSAPTIPFMNNMTGDWISPGEATSPDYWTRHLRDTVRFTAGLARVLEKPGQILIEVGPGRALSSTARLQVVKPAAVIPSMRHSSETVGDDEFLMNAVAQLWVAGVSPDWTTLHSGNRRRVALPGYPFERQRYWVDPDPVGQSVGVDRPRPQAARATGISDWFYSTSWRTEQGETRPFTGDVLVFNDARGIAKRAVDMARQAGEDVSERAAQPSLRLRAGDGPDDTRLVPCEVGEPGPSEVLIDVRAAALNFKDALKVAGMLPDASFGMECAGVVQQVGRDVHRFKPGDEVVAIGPDSFQSRVVRDARFLSAKPAGLSFVEAAALPAAFMTAVYALEQVGRIRRGERVLIHAASGGVGLAAVQVARAHGADIFATAGSEEKRAYLATCGVKHVFSSRTLDFEASLLKATKGEGVDLVLNSLTGDFISAGLRILRSGGRFLELGTREIYSARDLGAIDLKPGVSYHPIDLSAMLHDDPDAYGALMVQCMEAASAGKWSALPTRVFAATEAWQAFDLMLNAKHMGKLVLDFAAPTSRVWMASPGERFESLGGGRFTLNPDSAEDMSGLFDAIGPALGDLRHVVHAVNLGTEASQGADRRETFFGPLTLAQTIGRRELNQPLQITFVTSDLASIAGECLPDPMKSTVLGPALVMPRELPGVSTRVVDLAAQEITRDPERAASQLAEELRIPAAGETAAWRGTTRWIRRLERRPLQASPSSHTPIRDRGVYLLTGGTGGLGLEVARHLAKTHRPRLALLGRSAFPPRSEWTSSLEEHGSDAIGRRIRAILECETAGAEVLVLKGDVGNHVELEAAVADIHRTFGRVNGVFHMAGTIHDGLMQLKTREAADDVLRPKVDGTLALHEVLAKDELDFVVLFSSISSTLGLQGQVDYTAANAFLDAFAERRALEHGPKFVSIGWGPWQDAGLAAQGARERRGDGYPTSHPWLTRSEHHGENQPHSFRVVLARDAPWVIGEHVVRGGDAILPGTGYLELVRGAFAEVAPKTRPEISQVFFEMPLVVGRGAPVRADVSLTPVDGGFEFAVTTGVGRHASGKVSPVRSSTPEALALRAIEARCTAQLVEPNGMLAQPFMDFGPRWGNVRAIRYGHAEALVELALPQEFGDEISHIALHPALLDMATGSAQALIPGFSQAADFYVPFSYGRLRAYAPIPARAWSHIRLTSASDATAVFDVTVAGEDGTVSVEIEGFCMRRVTLPLRAQVPSPAATPTPWASLAEEMLSEGVKPREGLEALDRVLSSSSAAPHVYISTGDLAHWRARVDALAPEPVRQRTARSETTRGDKRPSTSEGVDEELRAMWSDLLGVSDVGPDDNFFDSGGHSLLAVRLLNRIEKRFGKAIPLQTLLQAGTPRLLSAIISDDPKSAPPTKVIIPLTEGDGPAFYCVHSLGGEVVSLLMLARALGPTQRFLGFQAPIGEGLDTFATSIESIAERYVRELITLQPTGPYYLGGWSAGSTIALEMAQQMHRAGRTVEMLVLLDGAPHNSGAERPAWDPRYAAKLARNLPLWIKDDLLEQTSAREMARRVRSKAVSVVKSRMSTWRGNGHRREIEVDGFIDTSRWSAQEQAFMRRLFKLLPEYRPSSYAGRVLLYQARTEPLYHLFEVDRIWRHLARNVDVVRVSGTHISLIQEPHVQELAADLRRRFRAAFGHRMSENELSLHTVVDPSSATGEPSASESE